MPESMPDCILKIHAIRVRRNEKTRIERVIFNSDCTEF